MWYDVKKYEEAETRYQEIVAARHAGLKIVVRHTKSQRRRLLASGRRSGAGVVLN